MIVPKMRHENERVNLLALAVSQRTLISLSLCIFQDTHTSLEGTPLSLSLTIHHLYFVFSHLSAAGSVCQELWAEVSSRTRQVSLPQRTHQNDLGEGNDFELISLSVHTIGHSFFQVPHNNFLKIRR